MHVLGKSWLCGMEETAADTTGRQKKGEKADGLQQKEQGQLFLDFTILSTAQGHLRSPQVTSSQYKALNHK